MRVAECEKLLLESPDFAELLVAANENRQRTILRLSGLDPTHLGIQGCFLHHVDSERRVRSRFDGVGSAGVESRAEMPPEAPSEDTAGNPPLFF